MVRYLPYAIVVSMLGLTAMLGQDKKPPETVVIKAKNGDVTFNHAAHLKREKNECKNCHPAPFTQDAKAAVKFRPPHKTEEDKKQSCGTCHRPGGEAFATANNCTNAKCHVRPAAKKG